MVYSSSDKVIIWFSFWDSAYVWRMYTRTETMQRTITYMSHMIPPSLWLSQSLTLTWILDIIFWQRFRFPPVAIELYIDFFFHNSVFLQLLKEALRLFRFFTRPFAAELTRLIFADKLATFSIVDMRFCSFEKGLSSLANGCACQIYLCCMDNFLPFHLVFLWRSHSLFVLSFVHYYLNMKENQTQQNF